MPTSEELLELAAAIERGEEITAGSWILDFMPDVAASAADHPNKTVLVTSRGRVFIGVTKR